ncbi:hypothetical protein ACHAW5_002338 [Stephanodiscus triporus]|uniref:Uncharacterized protein n=1 Tax=Stephanodiscus triporus TaxID=2934178 RepID=A0ABD3MRA2_9STRA
MMAAAGAGDNTSGTYASSCATASGGVGNTGRKGKGREGRRDHDLSDDDHWEAEVMAMGAPPRRGRRRNHRPSRGKAKRRVKAYDERSSDYTYVK